MITTIAHRIHDETIAFSGGVGAARAALGDVAILLWQSALLGTKLSFTLCSALFRLSLCSFHAFKCTIFGCQHDIFKSTFI
jgi:hypothetical protein